MQVFRLSRAVFAHELSGIGAAMKGARWNSIGFEIIYTAGNRSLAMAEVAVHLSLAMLPKDFMMLTIDIPDNIEIEHIQEDELPENWKDFPHPIATQKFGDNFLIKNQTCVLKVPSVVTQGDYNFLINPKHKDFSRIKIINSEKFPFDRRILK